jgi:putative phage-type endonuclease
MPVIEGLQQQTPEWLHMRCGIVTASRMSDVMATRKDKKEAAPRYNYKKELVYENITGLTWDTYVSPAMDWGTENEPLARAAYEHEHDVEIGDGGFFLHDEISKFGASPDGLLGDDGLIEIKCPTSGTHLETLLSGEIPEDYIWQMTAELDCTNRQWCDYVSFDPRMPKHLRKFEKRFLRDEARIKEMRDGVCTFLLEVIEMLKKLEPPQ